MIDKDGTKPTPSKDWPNTIKTQSELDSALEAGEKSGVSKRTFEDVVRQTKSSLGNG